MTSAPEPRAGATSRVAGPVSRLAIGNVVAQLAPVLFAPLLTRIYTPEAFGALAWALSIVAVASLIAGGTYEQAVFLPAERSVAASLVFGVIGGGVAAGLLLGLVAAGEALWRGGWLHRLWFVPIATVLTVTFNALSAWAVREGRFDALAASRILLALSAVAVSVALGYLGFAEAGLMLGTMAGSFAGILVLHLSLRGGGRPTWPGGGLSDVRDAARAYQRFPKLVLPSALLTTVTNEMPVWLLQRLFGPAVVGHYMLTHRVLTAPVTLISRSAGDVFKQRAAEEYRATGRSAETWSAFARPLAWAALPAGLVVLIAGPMLFAWIFGEPWRQAGQYARVLAIFFIARAVCSPLSYMIFIAGHHRLDLILQGCALGGAVLGWVAGALSGSPNLALGVFGGIYSLVYLAYFAMSRRIALGPRSPKP